MIKYKVRVTQAGHLSSYLLDGREQGAESRLAVHREVFHTHTHLQNKCLGQVDARIAAQILHNRQIMENVSVLFFTAFILLHSESAGAVCCWHH